MCVGKSHGPLEKVEESVDVDLVKWKLFFKPVPSVHLFDFPGGDGLLLVFKFVKIVKLRLTIVVNVSVNSMSLVHPVILICLLHLFGALDTTLVEVNAVNLLFFGPHILFEILFDGSLGCGATNAAKTGPE